MSVNDPTHVRLSKIGQKLEEHDESFEAIQDAMDTLIVNHEDLEARIEELEVSDGLADSEDEEEKFPDPREGAQRVGVVDGAELWDDPTGRTGMYLLSSARLREYSDLKGVAVTASTLEDLARIASIEDGNRGDD